MCFVQVAKCEIVFVFQNTFSPPLARIAYIKKVIMDLSRILLAAYLVKEVQTCADTKQALLKTLLVIVS